MARLHTGNVDHRAGEQPPVVAPPPVKEPEQPVEEEQQGDSTPEPEQEPEENDPVPEVIKILDDCPPYPEDQIEKLKTVLKQLVASTPAETSAEETPAAEEQNFQLDAETPQDAEMTHEMTGGEPTLSDGGQTQPINVGLLLGNYPTNRSPKYAYTLREIKAPEKGSAETYRSGRVLKWPEVGQIVAAALPGVAKLWNDPKKKLRGDYWLDTDVYVAVPTAMDGGGVYTGRGAGAKYLEKGNTQGMVDLPVPPPSDERLKKNMKKVKDEAEINGLLSKRG